MNARSIFIVGACIFSLTATAGLASASRPELMRMLAQAATEAPMAGEVPLTMTVSERKAIMLGWSVKKDILSKSVENTRKEAIGKVDDIIITPKNWASFAIIGVGGFLGMGERQVAIPMERLKMRDGRLELPGATKETLKALPPFKYSH